MGYLFFLLAINSSKTATNHRLIKRGGSHVTSMRKTFLADSLNQHIYWKLKLKIHCFAKLGGTCLHIFGVDKTKGKL